LPAERQDGLVVASPRAVGVAVVDAGESEDGPRLGRDVDLVELAEDRGVEIAVREPAPQDARREDPRRAPLGPELVRVESRGQRPSTGPNGFGMQRTAVPFARVTTSILTQFGVYAM